MIDLREVMSEYWSGGVANAVLLFVGLLSLVLGGREGSLPPELVI